MDPGMLSGPTLPELSGQVVIGHHHRRAATLVYHQGIGFEWLLVSHVQMLNSCRWQKEKNQIEKIIKLSPQNVP